MAAIRIFRRLRELLDVAISSPADGDVLAYNSTSGEWENSAAAGGGVTKLINLTDVTGTDGSGKAPVSDGADTFTLTDIATQAELNTEAASRISGDSASVATSEAYTDASVAALSSVYQPLDSDLTAIAALSTTSFGRSLLALADAAAGRTAFGLGTAATSATGDFDAAGAAAAAQAASQPLDSDLTAIAALSTTSFGRSLLALADAAALRTTGGLVIGTDVEAHDTDLTTIAGLSPTNDDVLQRKAGAWANRTIAQLLTDLAAAGTTFQPLDSDLTSIAALSTTSYGRALLTLANAAAADWITNALVDAKGDVLTATADNTPARLAVGSNGQVLQADSTQATGLKWGWGLTTLFDSTLGSSAASIDTGAGGIAGNNSTLIAVFSGRTDGTGAAVNVNLILNNDTGSNYDIQNLVGNSATASAGVGRATVLQPLMHGNGGTANYAATLVLVIPNYAGTTFYKTGFLVSSVADGASPANLFSELSTIGYRSTSALSRLKFSVLADSVQGNNFLTGTRLTIYGLG